MKQKIIYTLLTSFTLSSVILSISNTNTIKNNSKIQNDIGKTINYEKNKVTLKTNNSENEKIKELENIILEQSKKIDLLEEKIQKQSELISENKNSIVEIKNIEQNNKINNEVQSLNSKITELFSDKKYLTKILSDSAPYNYQKFLLCEKFFLENNDDGLKNMNCPEK